MNAPPQVARPNMTDAEWQARCDLAALYRITDFYGWTDTIDTHMTVRIPGEIQQMLDHVHGRFGGSYPQDTERAQPIRKIKRNDPCECGSGLKYKRCCGKS